MEPANAFRACCVSPRKSPLWLYWRMAATRIMEAFPDKETESWLLAHVHALEWMGLVLQVIIPDN